MPATHAEASRWIKQDWWLGGKVRHAEASAGGAVGVLFVWTERRDQYPIPTADFVVKPLASSAASTQFAEKVLTHVAKAASPESIEIKKGTQGFLGIQDLIRTLVHNQGMTPERAAPYQNAGCFVLQRMMAGYTEMSREYKTAPDNLKAMLNNQELMKNLGKLAAADLIIGNGDRIENGNFANVMFNAQGEVASIDSTAMLASYEQLMKAAAEAGNYGGSLSSVEGGFGTPQMRWVKSIATPDRSGGAAAPTDEQIQLLQARSHDDTRPAPVLPTVASLTFAEVNKDVLLWNKLERELRMRVDRPPSPGRPAITPPSEVEWQNAKTNFLIGFNKGLQRIDTLLGGLAVYKRSFMASGAWKELKKEYKEVGFSGVDPNLSWFNLVVRREIYRKLRGGATMKDAIAAGVSLAAKKENKMLKKERHG